MVNTIGLAIFRVAIFFFAAFAVAGTAGKQQTRLCPASNLRDSILDALRNANGNPLSKSQLSRGLKLPGTRITELRNTLDATGEGRRHHPKGKKHCYLLADAAPKNQLTGDLKFHPKGHAFFFPEITDEHNIATGIDFTSQFPHPTSTAANVGTSLDGDRVLVSILKPSPAPVPHPQRIHPGCRR